MKYFIVSLLLHFGISSIFGGKVSPTEDNIINGTWDHLGYSVDIVESDEGIFRVEREFITNLNPDNLHIECHGGMELTEICAKSGTDNRFMEAFKDQILSFVQVELLRILGRTLSDGPYQLGRKTSFSCPKPPGIVVTEQPCLLPNSTKAGEVIETAFSTDLQPLSINVKTEYCTILRIPSLAGIKRDNQPVFSRRNEHKTFSTFTFNLPDLRMICVVNMQRVRRASKKQWWGQETMED